MELIVDYCHTTFALHKCSKLHVLAIHNDILIFVLELIKEFKMYLVFYATNLKLPI